MKIENTEVFGFKSAIRGMRNPKDSWNLSDSFCDSRLIYKYDNNNFNIEDFCLGEADKKLSQNLTKAGTEHCKHLRLIHVWADLTLPRYIWQEFDTYKHTEKISCSTMHRLMTYDLNEDMFEGGNEAIDQEDLAKLKTLIEEYKAETNNLKRKKIKLKAKRKLPESFLQKRTINTNYQCLVNVLGQRKFHELPEWEPICEWIISLPYLKELTGIE